MSHRPKNTAVISAVTGRWLLLSIAACALSWSNSSLAVTHLQRGAEAPPLALKDRNGAEVTTAKLRDHVVVLVFGELYHEKTQQAWATIQSVLAEDRWTAQSIVTVLVTAREPREEDLKAFTGGRVQPTLARDPDRQAFGAYRVTAMPSIVVLGRDGRVVNAMAGLIPRLGDILTDSLLFACGKLTAEALDRSLKAVPTTQASEPEIRADRIAQLASQLARRDLPEMAADKYREALALNTRHRAAHLGLATLLLGQRHLSEAEAQFRAVLADQPDSTQAALGLAFVQTLRGGAELDTAEQAVRAVLARNPSQARAHYLMGLIFEQRNKPQEAAASFKKASELLLDRAEQE